MEPGRTYGFGVIDDHIHIVEIDSLCLDTDYEEEHDVDYALVHLPSEDELQSIHMHNED